MASNKMLIDASHPEETRVVVMRGNRIEEFDFESQNKRQLRGNIYLAKVTRVEPSLQAAFVDYGGNRHGFLAFNEIHPDYYQIPIADRQALLDEEAAEANLQRQQDDEEEPAKPKRKRRSRKKSEKNAEADETAANTDGDGETVETPTTATGEDTEAQAVIDAPSTEPVAEQVAEAVSEPQQTVEDKNNAAAGTEPGSDDAQDAVPDSDTPKSIGAEIETDSISEPAPDEPDPENGDGDEGSETAAAEIAADEPEVEPKKTPRKRTRRPRKKTVSADATSDDTNVKEEVANGEEEETAAVAAEETPVETPKKSRRKPAETKTAAPTDKTDKDANSDDNQEFESVGEEDAMEEVPRRTRATKRYRIQEVIKRRQVLLIQVVKEERGNKGAALTTYLSLAGRYSVLMPNTARGGGISRKITNATDRKRLKAIANELEVPEGMGVILRTAGASRTKADITRDFEYLMRLWENVRNLTLSSSAPNLVYEEGNLVKRSIRDLFDKDTTEVLVAGETGYKQAHEFMTMLMPNQAKKVKLYSNEKSLYANFGIEQQLDKMLQQQVTLKSGGYLVINQTEALVAIDVNSGRSTKEHSIEDTALRTNVEAAEEVARQLRLRDLAGLIVIDFIDMEEKRNNRTVEKKLKESLKNDRARIQIGRISHFGLMEMSRQRMRASVLESTMDICPHCDGRGHLRSHSSVALQILRNIDEHLLQNSRFDLTIKANSEIALYMLNAKREALLEIENRFGINLTILSNHQLRGENFTLEKGEASTGERVPINHIVPDHVDEPNSATGNAVDSEDEDNRPQKKRRRRRGKSSSENDSDANSDAATPVVTEETEEADDGENNKRKRRRGRRGGRKRRDSESSVAAEADAEDISSETPENDVKAKIDETPIVEKVAESAVEATPTEETPAPSNRRNARPGRKKSVPASEAEIEEVKSVALNNNTAETIAEENNKPTEKSSEKTAEEPAPRSTRRTTRRKKPANEVIAGEEATQAKEADANAADQSQIDPKTDAGNAAEPVDAQGADNDAKSKKGGWWSRNSFFK